MEKQPAIYIMASRYRGTLYVGVTSNLYSRVCDHKNGTTPGFTSDYKVHTLVWYEHHRMMDAAILREKRIKDWKRRWKIQLIEKMNPHWRDLHDDIDVLATLVEERKTLPHDAVIPAKAGTPLQSSGNGSSEID